MVIVEYSQYMYKIYYYLYLFNEIALQLIASITLHDTY